MNKAGLPLETVVLEVTGANGSGWSKVHLHSAGDEAVRKGTFTFPMPPLSEIDSFTIRPDMKATITISGDLWLTGRIGELQPSHGEESGEIVVPVLSNTIDSVESSVDHPTGFIKNADALKIAKEFESTGVEWVSTTSLPKEKWHDVNLGESAFATVERILRSRGKLIYDNEKGQMVIASGSEGRHQGDLELGKNIKSGKANLTSQGRHNPVKVRGQSSVGSGAGALRVEAEVEDESLGRKRPLVILLEGDVDDEKAKQRAEWQILRASGNSKTAQISVIGWRDDGGQLWKRNWLVGLNNPLLFLNQDMVIKSLDLHQIADSEEPEGTYSVLNLADPEALGSSGGKSKSDKAWKTPKKKAKLRIL